MRSLLLLGAALAIGVASPLIAQDEGTIDFGLFGRVTMPDDQLTNKTPYGGGARLGIFLRRNLALEFDISRNETEKADYLLMMPFSARLAYHSPIGANWSAIFGAGWVREYIAAGSADLYPDDGLTAMVGLRRRLTDRTSFRVDGIYEHLRSPIGETSTNDIAHSHYAVQFGFVFRFRNEQPAPVIVMPEPMPAPAPPADTDRDGVIDANDACANTPAGTRVDASGCAVPVDSDRDGVMDNADRCPNTAAGTRVDANGCPVPVDSDGDGVMDNADRCAGTPAGTRVDANGCAVPVDTDGDGVMDNVDVCANTKRGIVVDARGCARIFEEGKATVVLEGVNFTSGSAVLTQGAKVVLDKMAEALNGAPDITVEIQGHTDNTGSAALNTRLSASRAESVRAYLVASGVSATRLTAKGFGPAVPVADNGSATGRAQNRRVELKKTN